MEMFLMLFAMSLLGTAVAAALFAAATREEVQRAEKRPAERPRFFVPAEAAPASTHLPGIGAPATGPVPLEALLLQIERHIRLEQAAAESFHDSPTGESLHSRTASPLVN
jgi:hypothetical protein